MKANKNKQETRLTFNLNSKKGNKNVFNPKNISQVGRVFRATVVKDYKTYTGKVKTIVNTLKDTGIKKTFSDEKTKAYQKIMFELGERIKAIAKAKVRFKNTYNIAKRIEKYNSSNKIKKRLQEGKSLSEKNKIGRLIKLAERGKTGKVRAAAKRELNTLTDNQYKKLNMKRNKATKIKNTTHIKLESLGEVSQDAFNDLSKHAPATIKDGEISFGNDIQEVKNLDDLMLYNKVEYIPQTKTSLINTINKINNTMELHRTVSTNHSKNANKELNYFSDDSLSWLSMVRDHINNGGHDSLDRFKQDVEEQGLDGLLDDDFWKYFDEL